MSSRLAQLTCVVVVSLGLLFVFGCSNDGAEQEQKDRETVDEQQKQYAIVHPVPKFDYSRERHLVTELLKIRQQKVRTWTVWRSDYGKILGSTPSMGYPIPYDTQITNPLRVDNMYSGSTHGYGYGVIEQAEPNGLFNSKNSIATWVMSIDSNGELTPIYVEGKVNCYPYPIEVDYENDRVRRVAGSASTVKIKDAKK